MILSEHAALAFGSRWSSDLRRQAFLRLSNLLPGYGMLRSRKNTMLLIWPCSQYSTVDHVGSELLGPVGRKRTQHLAFRKSCSLCVTMTFPRATRASVFYSGTAHASRMRSSSLRRSTVPCHQNRAALLDSRLTEARGPCARLQYQPALVPEHRGTTELQKALSALHSIKLIMKSEWTEFRYNALLELGIHRLEGLVKVPWRSIPHDTSATSDLLSRLDSLRCCFLPDSTLQLRRECLSSAFSSLASKLSTRRISKNLAAKQANFVRRPDQSNASNSLLAMLKSVPLDSA